MFFKERWHLPRSLAEQFRRPSRHQRLRQLSCMTAFPRRASAAQGSCGAPVLYNICSLSVQPKRKDMIGNRFLRVSSTAWGRRTRITVTLPVTSGCWQTETGVSDSVIAECEAYLHDADGKDRR
jgi:hypothetical protein